MIFEVPSSLIGAKSGSGIGPESHLRRGTLRKASWRPLGALLEALGAEKSNVESLLGDLEARDPQMSGRTPGAGQGAAARRAAAGWEGI